jgi:hypothetical protein
VSLLLTGGRLEDALTYYKRSKDFGVERAAVHIRNVRLSSITPHGPPSSASNAGQRQDFRQEDERDGKRSGSGVMNPQSQHRRVLTYTLMTPLIRTLSVQRRPPAELDPNLVGQLDRVPTDGAGHPNPSMHPFMRAPHYSLA